MRPPQRAGLPGETTRGRATQAARAPRGPGPVSGTPARASLQNKGSLRRLLLLGVRLSAEH